MTFVDRQRLEALFRSNGMKLLELDETIGTGVLADGSPKDWHWFDINAEKL